MAQLRWQIADFPNPQLGLIDRAQRRVGAGTYQGLEFLEVEAKRIINTLKQPGGLPFSHTINVYRGCSHACTYCFARPTHEYLGLGLGTDFETKIVVKVNAVDLVWAETAPHRWRGQLIAMGTNTDPYQAAEGRYKLTRGVIEVLGQRANPFSILTKSPLVLRDMDVLTAAAARTQVRVDFSVGTLDEAVWRETEPGTAHPAKRIEAVARLNRAGIRSGVLIGPVLPGMSDSPRQIEAVVAAAVDAGAVSVGCVLLHLKPGLRHHYQDWIDQHHPELTERYRAWYGTRSYAPTAEQRRLSALVRRLTHAAGGDVSVRPRRLPPATRTPPSPRQLTLGE